MKCIAIFFRYISVGDIDEIELFYYFVESEREPWIDPLLLWLTGGPGCSGLSGLVYEIGSLSFSRPLKNHIMAEISSKNPAPAL